jgi:hypothetical protein
VRQEKDISMPTTSCYVAIQDGSTVLDHGGDIDHAFARFAAPDVNVNRRPVLSFRVNPDVGDGNVTLQMTLNQVVIVDQTFGSNEPRVWHEIVEANVLRAEDNELIATLTDTDDAGLTTLSDVVILYTNA